MKICKVPAKKAPSPVEVCAQTLKQSLGRIEGILAFLEEKKDGIESCLSINSMINLWDFSETTLAVHHPHDAAKLTRVLGGKWERQQQDMTHYRYDGITPIGLKCTIYEAEVMPKPERLLLGDQGNEALGAFPAITGFAAEGGAA